MVMDPTIFLLGEDTGNLLELRQMFESAQLHFETFESVDAFLGRCDHNRAGCLVVHVGMSLESGLDAQQRLRSLGYGLPVIIVSLSSDMAMAVRAMKAGAMTVLKSPVEPRLMMDTIREAIAKDARTRHLHARAVEAQGRLSLLTPREREVLELLVSGKANKEVAARLELSEKTVEIHRAHVMKKLQATNLAALVRSVLLASRLNDEASEDEDSPFY